MDSRRQLKLSQLIKEAFAEVLVREGKAIYGKAFVTVSNVRVNSDLSIVRFYLSIFNTENADAVVEALTEKKFEIKHALVEKLRHHLRRVPEIEFYKDDTLDYVFHMEDVFKKIKEEDKQIARVEDKPVEKKALPKKSTARKPKAK